MYNKKIERMLTEGYNCSQSVLCYFANRYGLEEKLAKRLAAPLESGLMEGKTCGAVTGAYLVLGLEYSQDGPDNRKNLMEKVRDFNRRFVEREKSLVCQDLLGLNIATDEGMAEAVEKDLIGKVCVKAIFSAIEILKEMIG